MPYIRKGKCVYHKHPDGSLTKKGCSSTEEKAKNYMKKLYSVEDEETFQEAIEYYLQEFSET